MPAAIHFITGRSFVERFERLLGEFRRAMVEFRSALLIVPTRRLAIQLRDSLGDCLAPLIFEFQGFADEIVRIHEWTCLPHPESDRRRLLNTVISELDDRALPDFARMTSTSGFVEAAARYIEELKDGGIEAQYLLKSHVSDSEKPGRCHQAALILDGYERQLAKSHRLDTSDRMALAAMLWARSKKGPFDTVRTVVLAGFLSLTPSEQQLLDAICETAEQLWLDMPEGFSRQFGRDSSFDGGDSRVAERTDPLVPLQSAVNRESSAASIHVIEAAGELSEARLIARHVREWLARGIPPGRLLVVSRRFSQAKLELFESVFDEFGIPFDAEDAIALCDAPPVAFLLRAWRLPYDDWQFSAVTSVLRCLYFRPKWPEVEVDPEVPAKAEMLLRMLGEARGREAYLRAVATWEFGSPEAMENEQSEEASRKHKQELARLCRPFLERFFKAWGGVSPARTASDAVAQLKAFAEEIGLMRASPDDLTDLARFWDELDRWAKEESILDGDTLHERFARALDTIAASPCRARSIRGEGVILLSAERAVGVDCDCLHLIGLGEGSWPDLTVPESLLDQAGRGRLCEMGLGLENPKGRFAREQSLFAALVSAPRREIVLSYAAIDGKGQPLLPCSFLREFLETFPATSKTRQRMLLDRYFDQSPMCDAELRTQSARISEPVSILPPELIENLSRARTVARARFASSTFGAFDGTLRDTATATELARRVGSNHVFSPTALDDYIACPFRFFLQHILGLEPLKDPSEEVEYLPRGSAVHRALARFHDLTKTGFADASGHADLLPTLSDALVKQIEHAVEECAACAPSQASAELWRLEGKRLARAASRYHSHWSEFRAPWLEKNATPVPHYCEAGFGMPGKAYVQPLVLTFGEVEVRIGGCIDRVDVAQFDETIGFWVIDYKTGRAANYRPSQVEGLEKLQLPLYALAVERVLLKDRPARPLGLAYWLVTDTGAKSMLPSGRNAAMAWVADPKIWKRFSAQLEEWVGRIVTHIRAGDFPLAPRSQTCTDTCNFGCVCRIAQSRNTGKNFPLELPRVIDEKGR